jgi:hypothetical protein
MDAQFSSGKTDLVFPCTSSLTNFEQRREAYAPAFEALERAMQRLSLFVKQLPNQ